MHAEADLELAIQLREICGSYNCRTCEKLSGLNSMQKLKEQRQYRARLYADRSSSSASCSSASTSTIGEVIVHGGDVNMRAECSEINNNRAANISYGRGQNHNRALEYQRRALRRPLEVDNSFRTCETEGHRKQPRVLYKSDHPLSPDSGIFSPTSLKYSPTSDGHIMARPLAWHQGSPSTSLVPQRSLDVGYRAVGDVISGYDVSPSRVNCTAIDSSHRRVPRVVPENMQRLTADDFHCSTVGRISWCSPTYVGRYSSPVGLAAPPHNGQVPKESNNTPLNNTNTNSPRTMRNTAISSPYQDLRNSPHTMSNTAVSSPYQDSRIHNVNVASNCSPRMASLFSEPCDPEQDSHWRAPDLAEVIEYLKDPSDTVKANAAAYLQHLCYGNEAIKVKTRQFGGIPVLCGLILNPSSRVHWNALGALRNLSFGRSVDENKLAIKRAGGISALVTRLKDAVEHDVIYLVTGILWNLSSCQEVKRCIIDEAVGPLVHCVVVPQSGKYHSSINTSLPSSFDGVSSAALCNALGVLRNVSCHGEYARSQLRNCSLLVESVIDIVQTAIGRSDIDNKSIENCVCILCNLSYACQEIEDPDYLLKRTENTSIYHESENSMGCCNKRKHKRRETPSANKPINRLQKNSNACLLWQPEIVRLYTPLLALSTNPDTLEAAAGALQNLTACNWQPSVNIREAVRNENIIPVIVELLNVESDRVFSSAAVTLRNLAVDDYNKELIGRYAMTPLVKKLPVVDTASREDFDTRFSTTAIAAILMTLLVIIKASVLRARSFIEAGGIDRLLMLTGVSTQNDRIVCLTAKLLNLLWSFDELRGEYKKKGLRETDFVGVTSHSVKSSREQRPVKYDTLTLTRPQSRQVTADNEKTLRIERRTQVNTKAVASLGNDVTKLKPSSPTPVSDLRISKFDRREVYPYNCGHEKVNDDLHYFGARISSTVPIKTGNTRCRNVWYMEDHDNVTLQHRQFSRPVTGHFITADEDSKSYRRERSRSVLDNPKLVSSRIERSNSAVSRRTTLSRSSAVFVSHDSWV